MSYFDDRFDRFNFDQSTYTPSSLKTNAPTDSFKSDYNYEYDRFPKDFKFSRRFMGISNGSELDKFYTESFLTNKVKNIEKTYVGSDELPESYLRDALPQKSSAKLPCRCSKCQPAVDNLHISKAIEELQKKNDVLVLILLFIVIYCVIQLITGASGANIQLPIETPPQGS